MSFGVMRPRRKWLSVVIGALVVIGGVYLALLSFGRHPAKVSVSVVGQESSDRGTIILVRAINTGRTPLVYHGDPPFAELRVATTTGWTNVPQRHLSQGSTFGILLSGGSLSYEFTVPSEVNRLKVCCYFETAGARSWAAGQLLETGWWNRLHPIGGYLLELMPDGRPQNVEFWSPETNIH